MDSRSSGSDLRDSRSPERAAGGPERRGVGLASIDSGPDGGVDQALRSKDPTPRPSAVVGMFLAIDEWRLWLGWRYARHHWVPDTWQRKLEWRGCHSRFDDYRSGRRAGHDPN
jgi:hypothetical protein